MSVRAFDWRDLLNLHRYRHQSVFLDSSLVLTRGELLVPGALFSTLAPSLGVFTGVAEDSRTAPVIGQFIHLPGAPLARLTFLAPESALDSALATALLDYLLVLAGERGALRLLAEVDERSPAFESLRRSGFAIYARQRIWRLQPPPRRPRRTSAWRTVNDRDLLAVRLLYNNLVPGLVQQMEPFTPPRAHGLVAARQDNLLAYVEFKSGTRGVWVQPFFHPDVEEPAGCLLDLLASLPNTFGAPIYVCVRSYLSWLEPALEEISAQPGPRQAVMIKQLTAAQKASRPLALPGLENTQPDLTAPVAHIWKVMEIDGTTTDYR